MKKILLILLLFFLEVTAKEKVYLVTYNFFEEPITNSKIHAKAAEILSFYGSDVTNALPVNFYNWETDSACKIWVDSVFNQLSWEERIGQFFMIAAYTSKDKFNMPDVLNTIKRNHVGAVLFFQGSPTIQADWTNQIQSASKVPLMIAIDGEWGLNMRLDSTIQWPRNLTLGAINDEGLIRQLGEQYAYECKRVGVQVNFAPVVDVNSNPNNPVINDRSFGEDKYRVAMKGLELCEGMQSKGVLACAKHFPGHGDTDQDSHYTLPTVKKTKEKIESEDLYPFQFLFNNGIGSVMLAHLNVPALDNESKLPTSLSKKIATELVKEKLGYKGLIFSDALNMKAVSAAYVPGTVDSMAFVAGNDILDFSENCAKGIQKILAAKQDGTLTESELTFRVKKVLGYKYLLGLNSRKTIATENVIDDLNKPNAKLLKQNLYDRAMTIACDENNLIPLKIRTGEKVASLSIDSKSYTDFQNYLQQFYDVDLLNVPNESPELLNPLTFQLSNYSQVIIDVHGMSRYASKGFGISQNTVDFINDLSKRTKVILVLFGTPYSLKYFDDQKAVLVAYEDQPESQLAAANVLLGGLPALGKLPVSASSKYKVGQGILRDQVSRLKIASPESAQVSSEYLQDINEVVLKGIVGKAYPGCQVLITKDNQIIWNKAYGNKIYESQSSVKLNDLYDLASITKIAATTLAVMKLYDEGKLNLNNHVGDYVTFDDSATVTNLKIADLMTHHAGLRAFFEFYKSTIDSNYNKFYTKSEDDFHTIKVADNIYSSQLFADSMWEVMIHSEVKPERNYLYSDLDFYIMQKVVESITQLPLDIYVDSTFYKPLGLTRMTYLPREKFSKDRIVPTENDKYFRRQILQGNVHDPGAALYGGVAGHAGLFSNALDLAQIMQLLLNKGSYNGKQFFKPETVVYFTKQYDSRSRRGLGFDKPEPDSAKQSPCCERTPLSTFGHTGFTGTCVWSDPSNNLTIVFLSNRVYPDADNPKLVRMGIRTDIQKIVYKAIEMGKSFKK